jgi:hypothetical protein
MEKEDHIEETGKNYLIFIRQKKGRGVEGRSNSSFCFSLAWNPE